MQPDHPPALRDRSSCYCGLDETGRVVTELESGVFGCKKKNPSWLRI
jgi:hypothetical protein